MAPASEPAAAAASAALVFAQVNAGASHTCGVTTDDRTYCWGFNQFGQLGDGTTTDRLVPKRVVGGRLFRQVRPGWFATCGVTTTDRLYCWGELGGTTPVQFAGGLRFRQVSVGPTRSANADHHCGVTTDDRAYCWGWNHFGQLGDGTTTDRPNPVPVAGTLRFRTVSVGYQFACGVTTDDRAYCWGSNLNGQLGDGTTMDRLRPRLVAGGLRFRQLSVGVDQVCGVTTTNQAYCWGENTSGELGDGVNDHHRTPFPVAGGLSFRQVSTLGSHSCGVTTANRAYCWGYNFYGNLGIGTRTGDGGHWWFAPVAVAGGLSFQSITVGGDHTCGRTTLGAAYCWGYNRNGQLGVMGRALRLTPTAVVGPS